MKRSIGIVSRRVFTKMHEIARDYDLENNGIMDSRGGGAVNFWCSPDDKPEDWKFEITRGSLKYPREYLGTVYPEFQTNHVRLTAEVTNYSRKETAEKSGDLDEIKLAQHGTEAEWKWLLSKIHWLRDLAEKEQNFETKVVCPYCNKSDFKTMNELVECIISHGVAVKSIVLGQGILTEKGMLTEKDYTKLVKVE